jgi:hypothetical protein
MISLHKVWSYIQRNVDQHTREKSANPCFIAALYTIANVMNQSSYLKRAMNKENMMCMYNGQLFSKKE